MGKKRTLEAKIRLTGDLPDHLSLDVTSLSVKLLNGSIDGITQFRLLVPKTRNGDNEIFISSLFETLGFPTLYTRMLTVVFDGSPRQMIFQEKPKKEFLERFGIRETVIVEGDERQMTDSWYYAGPYSQCCISKVDNGTFIKNNIAVRIANRALQLATLFFANEDTHHNKKPINIIANNEYYETILKSLNAEHGLSANNRKLIFNPLYDIFIPIYYDGNASYQTRLDALKLDGVTETDRDTSPLATDFELMYRRRGGEVSKFLATELFRDIVSTKMNLNLFNIPRATWASKFAINAHAKDHLHPTILINSMIENAPGYFSYAINDNYYNCIISSNRRFEKNLLDNSSCNTLSLKDYTSLLKGKNKPQKFNGRKIFYQNFGNLNFYSTEKDYRSAFRQRVDYKLNAKELHHKILVQDVETAFIVFENFNGVEDPVVTLDLNLNSSVTGIGAVVLMGNLPRGLQVNISSNTEEMGRKKNPVRYNEHLLTGCLTILDSDFRDISISMKNLPCEDGLNIVSSTGTISNIVGNQFYYDAVDFDFSSITVKRVNIKNAENDCIDLSAGNYTIIDAHLSFCNDKGISVGEKALVRVQKAFIEEAKTGIAVKDSAQLDLNEASIKKVDICLAAYNKKQEFGGGKIIVNIPIRCSGSNFVDAMSVIH